MNLNRINNNNNKEMLIYKKNISKNKMVNNKINNK